MIDATILENEDEFQNNVLNAEILEAELL